MRAVPVTPTGKLLRRELKEMSGGTQPPLELERRLSRTGSGCGALGT